MGNGCKVKEYTKKKIKFAKLAEGLSDFVVMLKNGFERGENLPKKIMVPSVERQLKESIGDNLYSLVLTNLEEIESLMYGNTPEWKRRVTDYVNGWVFIQNQVLYNLRLIQDLFTNLTSAAIMGEGVMQPAERYALQEEVNQIARKVILIATHTKGPDGSSLLTTPSIYGESGGDGAGTGAQPFLGPDGKKVTIKGSVQFYHYSKNDYSTGSSAPTKAEDLLWQFLVVPDVNNVKDLYFNGTASSGATVTVELNDIPVSTPEIYVDGTNTYILNASAGSASGAYDLEQSPDDTLRRLGGEDRRYKQLNYENSTDPAYPAVHWADVRSDLYSKFTVITIAGNIDNSNADEIHKGRIDSDTDPDYENGVEVFRRPAPYNLQTNNNKNLATSIQECISIQSSRIEQNQKTLELAIEQSKMAYEKAHEIQREIESIIEDAECILTQRSDLSALLAVTSATSLVG